MKGRYGLPGTRTSFDPHWPSGVDPNDALLGRMEVEHPLLDRPAKNCVELRVTKRGEFVTGRFSEASSELALVDPDIFDSGNSSFVEDREIPKAVVPRICNELD